MLSLETNRKITFHEYLLEKNWISESSKQLENRREIANRWKFLYEAKRTTVLLFTPRTLESYSSLSRRQPVSKIPWMDCESSEKRFEITKLWRQ